MRTVIQVRAVIIEALLLELSGPDRFHLIVKRLHLISAAFRNPSLMSRARRFHADHILLTVRPLYESAVNKGPSIKKELLTSETREPKSSLELHM